MEVGESEGLERERDGKRGGNLANRSGELHLREL